MAEQRAAWVANNFFPTPGVVQLQLPHDMGEPLDSQLNGTHLENVCELAGRVCYDSLGSGRSSEEFWKHIHEVKHLSIVEHAVICVRFRGRWKNVGFMAALLNRTGVYTNIGTVDAPNGTWSDITVCANLRAIAEWFDHKGHIFQYIAAETLGKHLTYWAHALAPKIVPWDEKRWRSSHDSLYEMMRIDSELVEPVHEHEVWVTAWLKGSRGFSHELVRHGDHTAISQRSTRYVDESIAPWCIHPELVRWLEVNEPEHEQDLSFDIQDVSRRAQSLYRRVVERLEPAVGRKQARGAARGFLGNALETQLIFSASVTQWRHIFRMRCHEAADAEIREIMAECLKAFKASPSAAWFNDLHLNDKGALI